MHVVTVASGKGGVGKSTVSLNLALALAERVIGLGCWTPTCTAPTSR
jgi:MinD superfamily P-loop ATPase